MTTPQVLRRCETVGCGRGVYALNPLIRSCHRCREAQRRRRGRERASARLIEQKFQQVMGHSRAKWENK